MLFACFSYITHYKPIYTTCASQAADHGILHMPYAHVREHAGDPLRRLVQARGGRQTEPRGEVDVLVDRQLLKHFRASEDHQVNLDISHI